MLQLSEGCFDVEDRVAGVQPENWLESASPDAITAQPLEITLRLGAM
ncbi:MAG TPA: hypothetical protein VGJ91_05990 [Polyangiaceae bacterium]